MVSPARPFPFHEDHVCPPPPLVARETEPDSRFAVTGRREPAEIGRGEADADARIQAAVGAQEPRRKGFRHGQCPQNSRRYPPADSFRRRIGRNSGDRR